MCSGFYPRHNLVSAINLADIVAPGFYGPLRLAGFLGYTQLLRTICCTYEQWSVSARSRSKIVCVKGRVDRRETEKRTRCMTGRGGGRHEQESQPNTRPGECYFREEPWWEEAKLFLFLWCQRRGSSFRACPGVYVERGIRRSGNYSFPGNSLHQRPVLAGSWSSLSFPARS